MQRTAELSPELAAALEQERERSEQLLWAAEYDHTVEKAAQKWATIAGGMLLLGFSTYCVRFLLQIIPDQGVEYGAFAFSLALGIVGLMLLITAFRNVKNLLQTGYVITTKRVLIIQLIGTRRETRSFVPRDANLLKRVERQSGMGDLLLGTVATGDVQNVGLMNVAQNVALMNVADVRGVERLVRETFFADPAPDR